MIFDYSPFCTIRRKFVEFYDRKQIFGKIVSRFTRYTECRLEAMLMRNFDASDIENGAVRTCREIISRPRISKIFQISIECDNWSKQL